MSEEIKLEELTKEGIKEIAEKISLLMKAVDGQAIEPDDIIRQLINLKDIRERSRFPTYPILARNVYLRLIYDKYPEYADSCLRWANHEAHCLIAHKGEGRKEAVEMSRSAQIAGADQQTIMYNSQLPQQQKKSRFWNRGNKPQSEFVNE